MTDGFWRTKIKFLRIDLGHLAAWHHEPKGGARAQILLVHGISEHSGRYLRTIDTLLNAGYGVTRFDLRGAGESGGRRQWVEKFSDYVEDTNTVYTWMGRNLTPKPFFVMGHSLGGAIALRFAAHRSPELAGLILSAPAYIVGGVVSPLKIKVGRFLNRFASTIKIPKYGDPVEISRDLEEVKAFKNDPLSVHYNTVGQGTAILDTLPDSLEVAKKIKCPIFMVHGSNDQLIRIEGSFALFQALGAEKEFFIQPGGFHEPHNDFGKEAYFARLIQWLDSHSENSLSPPLDRPAAAKPRAPSKQP